jgi:hypothetical protein
MRNRIAIVWDEAPRVRRTSEPADDLTRFFLQVVIIRGSLW